MRNHNRRSAHPHFFNRAGCAFDFKVNAAGAMHEIALLNNKANSAVNSFRA